MKIERVYTGGWSNAVRGLRHPLESYKRSDSDFGVTRYDDLILDKPKTVIVNYGNSACEYVRLGNNDLDLMQRMIKAGSPNDKFLRQIFVSMDVTAPLYFFKEFDQYKVSTTTNSTSTMHKLASTPITLDCFETDDYEKNLEVFPANGVESSFTTGQAFQSIIDYCEALRVKYNETQDKRYWKELIRLLPESWLQTRMWSGNYAILRNIIHWRTGHRLTEWSTFIDFLYDLPYADELLFFENK